MPRLLDLHPKWQSVLPSTARVEVSFDCPVCVGEKAHRVYVPFANPFDGGTPIVRNHLWTVSGDSFKNLTVTPSVDYTRYDNGTVRDAACWHGHLTNGVVS